MTIECKLDEKTFKDFTRFDILRRKKYWKSPVIFACLMSISAIVCFMMNSVRGAVMLGCVLACVGWGMPLIYFTTFFFSLNKTAKLQKLDPPRLVYTLELTEAKDGIKIRNEKEEASYLWKDVFHAYRDKSCIYLYITAGRAFLLPEKNEEVWLLIIKKLGAERTTVL
ncbi:MAG: YcxB family protein [Sphaerochaetaceae bacterium]|nr:YcxB family protein [Sphaerochaetaceae bacterium]